MTDWPTDARALFMEGYTYGQTDGVWHDTDAAGAWEHYAKVRAEQGQQPNETKLGRLRLALKQLADEASEKVCHPETDHFPCGVCAAWRGRSAAYRHALDLVMQLEREQ